MGRGLEANTRCEKMSKKVETAVSRRPLREEKVTSAFVSGFSLISA